MNAPLGGLLGQIRVEPADQPFAHHAMLRCDLIAVAINEAGVQRRDQPLIDRRVAAQPPRLGERGVTEQWTLQPGQLGDGKLSLCDCGATDFIADFRRICVAEQDIEDASRSVESGVIARRDRSAQARGDIPVEADFTLVKTQTPAGLPAHRVGGRNLEHHGVGSAAGSAVGIVQLNPVALAHLTGADPLDAEIGDGSGADRCSQPGGGEITGAFDDIVGVRFHGSSTKSHPPSSRQREALPRHPPFRVRIEFEMGLAVEDHHRAFGVGVGRPVVAGHPGTAE